MNDQRFAAQGSAPARPAIVEVQTAISRLVLVDIELELLLLRVCELLARSLDCHRVGFFEESDGAMVLRTGVGWDEPGQHLDCEVPEQTVAQFFDVEGVPSLVAGFTSPSGRRAALVASPVVADANAHATAELVGLAAELVSHGWARRQLEDELRASEQRLVEAQELGHMGSYDWNILTDENVWSDELYRIYGHEPQSFNASYEKFLAMIHPDDRERISAVHQAAYATLEPYSMQERIVRPDGTVRTLASTGEVIADDQGRPIRMRGTCIDITERLRVEAEAQRLSRAEDRRRQALEINDNVVQGLTTILWSLESGLVDGAEVATRRTLESARSMMSELLHDPSDINAGDLVREAAPDRLLTDVSSVQDAATTEQPVDERPAREAETVPTLTTVVLADDSPDIRLLLKLQLSALPSIVVVGEAASGPEAVECVREHRPDVVLLDMAMPDGDGLGAIPEIVASSPETVVIALSGFSAEELSRPALDAGACAFVEKGEFEHLVTALVDAIPALGAAAPSRLDDLEPQIEIDPVGTSPDLALGHLVHELKTPATVVSGVAQMLAGGRDNLPSAAVRELHETLLRSSQALLELLDRVSTTVGAANGELEFAAVDLSELVRETAADLGLALGRDVEIVADDVAPVGVDRLRVTQVLTNLLTNAARFAPDGTAVVVRVRERADHVEIVVSDDGPGVDPAVVGRLFRPFVRDTRGMGGLGLGLYVSRRIARAHGGELRCDAGSLGGRFELVLPRR